MTVHDSHQYREYLRGVRMFLNPELDALLGGVRVSDLTMRDLEALYELVFDTNPRDRAPPGYRPVKTRVVA
jgi:hypothetical protein